MVQLPLIDSGLPLLRPELSQWQTPTGLAKRAAAWIPREGKPTILEPCAGGGALLGALLDHGHQPGQLLAQEIDPAWARVLRERFPGVDVRCQNALLPTVSDDPCDWVLMNPPYETNLHVAFVLRALERAPNAIAIVPASIEFGAFRARALWSRVRVVRRARCMRRPRFGGPSSGEGEIVVLHLQRRSPGETENVIELVREERW